jgi:hypothetical protein
MDRESVKRGLLFGLASACLATLLCVGLFHAKAGTRLHDYFDRNFSKRDIDYAIRWGDARLLDELLRREPLEREGSGRLVIRAMVWWRARVGRSSQGDIKRMQAKSCEMLKVLLKNGVDVNDGGEHNETPLYATIQFEMPDAAKLLLENGAQTDILVGPGGTPLLYYVLVKGRPYFDMLVEHGADVNIRGRDGRTLMQLAAAEKLGEECCGLLAEAGAAGGSRIAEPTTE